MRRAVGIIILLAACGRTSNDETTVQPTNDTQWTNTIAPLVSADCGPCHTGGQPSLPQFTSAAAFKASNAAGELQGGTMPPSPRTISPGDKATLLAYLGK